MKVLGTTLAALGLCVAVAACESPQQKIAGKEDMMTAAGFKFVPANTPARQQSFRQLPPHKFARQIRNGQVFYVYPDPTVCVCLYVGDQNAYATYRNYPAERLIKLPDSVDFETAAGMMLQGSTTLWTLLRLRAPGVTMMRMPVFCWTQLVTCLMVAASRPPASPSATRPSGSTSRSDGGRPARADNEVLTCSAQ